mgnify:CR=1 FL=1
MLTPLANVDVLFPVTARFVVVAPVATRFVANRFVLVALVMVAVGAKNPPIAERSPEKYPVPPTARVAAGAVVAIPSDPPAVMTEVSVPALL